MSAGPPGPYRQPERIETYSEYAKELVDQALRLLLLHHPPRS